MAVRIVRGEAYLRLCLMRLASAKVCSRVSTTCMASARFFCISWYLTSFGSFNEGEIGELGMLVTLLDQSDFMTLTRTRVPSLFTGTESECRTRARI
jgi:hypothetical protein